MRYLTRSEVEVLRRTFCGATLGAAIVVLLGWAFHLPLATTVLPGLTTMKANTAVALAAAALGLLAPPRSGAAAALALLVFAIGAATLLEYLFDLRLGIDELLVVDPATTSMPYPGRMSPASAMSFVAIGLALPLLARGRQPSSLLLAHVLALMPGLVSYLSLVGYVYGIERLYNFGPYVSVALNTAAGLGLLSAAMLLTRDREGWTRSFVDHPIAIDVLVELIAIAAVLPFATGLLIETGAALGYYQPLFGPALFAMLASVAFVFIALKAAHAVRRAEDAMQRARSEAEGRARALQASDQRYRFALDNIAQLVWRARADGELTFVNRNWLDFTGSTAEAVLGTGWQASLHPDDLERAREHWRDALARRRPYELEYRLRRADGAYRWFKVTGSPSIDAEDGAEYWIGSLTDIQDLVEARETVARSQAELEGRVAARTAELMLAEEQLRQSQKMEAVGQLTGGLAHDFNNLLAGISGSLELMQIRVQQGRFGDVDRYMAASLGATRRAAALTHRLLAFSRRQTLDPRPTDVNRLIGGMQEMIQRTVGPAIPVEVVGVSGLWPALVDPSQLENALLNLCINARDAMPDGGRITVETANRWFDERAARQHDMPEGQYLSLSISDTGTGMSAEVIARAFEPFFTTKPIGEGTGLGLSMIYGFAQQSGGQVRIYSEVGEGTTVSIYLPRHHGDVEDDDRPKAPRDRSRSDRGETVLVVDDEPTVRMLVTDVLGDLGYAAIEAGDSAAGLRILQSEARIDLLVTDVGLPGGMNGRQMADAGRVRRPDLKVLFITGYAENAAVGNGHLAPGMAVLTKPFAIEDMAARIRSLIEAA